MITLFLFDVVWIFAVLRTLFQWAPATVNGMCLLLFFEKEEEVKYF